MYHPDFIVCSFMDSSIGPKRFNDKNVKKNKCFFVKGEPRIVEEVHFQRYWLLKLNTGDSNYLC